MKRSGIARGTTRMRRGRMKSVNKERKARRYARDFGPLAGHIRKQGCCCCNPGTQQSPTQACHVKSRGAGGHAENNLIPMCHEHHAYQHAHGWSALSQLILPGSPEGKEWAERLAGALDREFRATEQTNI